jgi:hypothetical protein
MPLRCARDEVFQARLADLEQVLDLKFFQPRRGAFEGLLFLCDKSSEPSLEMNLQDGK